MQESVENNPQYQMDPQLFIAQYLMDISKKLEVFNNAIKDLDLSQTPVLRGETGPSLPGRAGRDGKTPVKGVDYMTEEEVEEIVKKALARIRIPRDGKSETAESIVEKLNSLKNVLNRDILK